MTLYVDLINLQFPIPNGMMATSGFAVWFLKLFKNKKTAISCPESTVLVKRTMRASSQHREWLDLAKHEQVTIKEKAANVLVKQKSLLITAKLVNNRY